MGKMDGRDGDVGMGMEARVDFERLAGTGMSGGESLRRLLLLLTAFAGVFGPEVEALG